MAERRYTWRGINRQGRTVDGEMQADTAQTVTQRLREQRIRTTHIQRHYALPTGLKHFTKASTSMRDITQFTRQLATLLHAGVPLLQAFQILERGQNRTPLKTLTQTLHQHIESGMTLHHALRKHPQFDVLYCNLVAVGELAGMLDSMLERLATHLEKTETLRATVRSALIYPSAVLGIAISVLILILVFVVPEFQTIFTSFGAELPWLTRSVITLSETLQQHGGWLLLGIFSGSWWLKKQVAKRVDWQCHLHRVLLRIPIAGVLTRYVCTARWTRTLATLLAAGVPLTEALVAVEDVTGHLLFQSATQTIQSELIQGRALTQALENTHDLFPSMVVQMCAIGEESGTLDHMLEKTAEYYEREVDHTVARLSTLLEPFIMVVLGLLIGGLMMALYLPIFQLGQVV